MEMNDVASICEELEKAGLIERNGQTRWGEQSCEWQPVYVLTELGRALGATIDDAEPAQLEDKREEE
jgi:hypothetical protein